MRYAIFITGCLLALASIIGSFYAALYTPTLIMVTIPLAAFGGCIIGGELDYVLSEINEYIYIRSSKRKQLKKENDPNNERVLLIYQYYLDQRNIKDMNIYINSLGMKIVKISYSPLENAHYVGVDKFVNIPHRIDIANVYGKFDWYGIR